MIEFSPVSRIVSLALAACLALFADYSPARAWYAPYYDDGGAVAASALFGFALGAMEAASAQPAYAYAYPQPVYVYPPQPVYRYRYWRPRYYAPACNPGFYWTGSTCWPY